MRSEKEIRAELEAYKMMVAEGISLIRKLEWVLEKSEEE